MEGTHSSWEQLSQHYKPPLIKGLTQGPCHPATNRTLLALRLRDYAAAERQACAALDASPHTPGLYDLRCAIRLFRRDHEGALEDARSATSLDPGAGRAWACLGAAQLGLGHPRAALSAFQHALALEPGDRLAGEGRALAETALQAQPGRREAVLE
ncbi:hypothetical protein ACKKBG_A37380 [Auxenochlorella protothecoides x Auxenochlorella symbiontica]